MTFTKSLTCVAALGAALWTCEAAAVEPPGARPGDDALTCDQIWAEGSALSQQEQAEREKRNEERRGQSRLTAGLVTAAALAGGMGGTAQAAQKAAETQVASTMVDAATPPPANPRKEHLRQLWMKKQCTVKK